jgi:hypothetical protein
MEKPYGIRERREYVYPKGSAHSSSRGKRKNHYSRQDVFVAL